MTNKQIFALISAMCLSLSAAGCGKKEKPAKDDIKTANATNVMVYEVGAERIENSVSYTGELKTADSTAAVSKVNAKVVKVNVKEGDYVKSGTVLAELDDTDIKSAYQTALANFNSAQASYNSIVNSSTKQAMTTAKNALESAQLAYNQALETYNREKALYESGSTLKLAQQAYDDALAKYNREREMYNNDTSLVSARNNLANAQTALENTKALYEIGAASKTEYDNAVTNVENMRANLTTLEAQRQTSYDSAYSAMVNAEENLTKARLNESASYDAAKNALDKAASALSQAKENINLTAVSNNSSITTASASLSSAKTALETAKNNLNNTKIKSVSSGYVASKSVEVGQMAAAGTPLFTIKNTNTLVAEIEITESVIPFVSEGTKAVVNVSSVGIEEMDGTVTLVNPVKNEQSGMYKVQVAVENKDSKLKIGMFAEVVLVTSAAEDAIVIPTDAILIEGEKNYVYVAMPDGKTAEKREVVVGIESDSTSEIISGIELGDKVIISGHDYLSEENNEINIVTE